MTCQVIFLFDDDEVYFPFGQEILLDQSYSQLSTISSMLNDSQESSFFFDFLPFIIFFYFLLKSCIHSSNLHLSDLQKSTSFIYHFPIFSNLQNINFCQFFNFIKNANKTIYFLQKIYNQQRESFYLIKKQKYMNLQNVTENLQCQSKNIILQQSNHKEEIYENFQNKNTKMQYSQRTKIQTKQQNEEKKKRKKNGKKHNFKYLQKKNLNKNQVSTSMKNLLKKSQQKIKKYTKTQDVKKQISNQFIVPVVNQNKTIPVKNNSQYSPSKKTIISERNMVLKPFEQKAIISQYESQSNFFGSLNDYLSDFEKEEKNLKQNTLFQNNEDDFSKKQHSKIGNKFLSHVLRKNTVQLKSKQKIKFPSSKSQIKLQKTYNILDSLTKKQQSNLKQNFFHNDRLSKNLSQKENQISQKINQDNSENKSKIERLKIFRIKTEVIHSAINSSFQRQQFKKIQGDKSQRYDEISNEFIPYKFIPVSNSSLDLYNSRKIQNLQSIKIQNDVIHQCYQDLKSKSKKLIRYSLIRQPNLSLLENKSKKVKDMKNDVDSLKELIKKEKSKFKLPLIANGQSLQQKKCVKEKSSLLNSIYHYKKNPKLKQEVDLTKNNSQIFQKYSKHLHTENIKERLRCYTELDSAQGKVRTQCLKNRVSLQSTKNISPTNSINEIIINKSLSSKIIQSFYQRYKETDTEDLSYQQISNVNLSQKFISRCRDSFDWQHKKKLIIKKLGIII